MVERGRQTGDIIHLIDPRPEKKHLLTALCVSLLVHAAAVGKPVYDAWKRVEQWRDLFAIRVVDDPVAVAARRRARIIALSEPLYYPAWLVKPKSDEPSNQQEEESALEETPPQPEDSAQTLQESASADNPTPSPDEVQAQIERLRRGVQRAQTLNIGPIREQIETIYQAQQSGQISIGDLSVAVNFRVRPNGGFTHVRLIESSGVSEVDNAALLIVDELNELQALAPLRESDSVTLRLIIGREVEFRVIMAAPSAAVAADDVKLLNGLLLAARLWTATQKDAEVAKFLSNIEIKQEGINILTRARIPRSDASRLLREEFRRGG